MSFGSWFLLTMSSANESTAQHIQKEEQEICQSEYELAVTGAKGTSIEHNEAMKRQRGAVFVDSLGVTAREITTDPTAQ
jgi:hypothetical protein